MQYGEECADLGQFPRQEGRDFMGHEAWLSREDSPRALVISAWRAEPKGAVAAGHRSAQTAHSCGPECCPASPARQSRRPRDSHRTALLMPFWSNLEKLGRDGVWHAGIPRPPLTPCLELGLESSGGPVLLPPPVAPSYSGCRQHPAIGTALPHGSTAGVVLNPGPCGHCQHWDVPSSRDHLGCHEARGVPTELQDNSKGDTESAAGEDRQPGSAAVDQELLKS